jgi:hypothetical protein
MTFQAAGPFMAFHRGDLLNPRGWDSRVWSGCREMDRQVLVVTGLEHILWENEAVVTRRTVIHTKRRAKCPENPGVFTVSTPLGNPGRVWKTGFRVWQGTERGAGLGHRLPRFRDGGVAITTAPPLL